MRIGIMGPLPSIKLIHSMDCMKDMYIDCVEYPCDLNVVPDLLDEIQKDLDGIVFTGTRYFRYATQYASASIPWVCVERSNATLFCILLQASLAGKDIRRITYDLSISEEMLVDLLCDKVGLNFNQLALYRYNDTQQYRDYMELKYMAGKYAPDACKYHLENLQSGRADICLTDSSTVAYYMEQAGQPVYYYKMIREDVVQALNNLISRHQVENQLNEVGHQEAVMRITVQLADTSEGNYQGYRQVRCNYQIESSIHSFAQKIGATVEKKADLEYLIYSTKAELDFCTNHFSKLEFIERLYTIVGVEQIFVGLGFGITHSKAKINAQWANKSARCQQNSCYYIKDENEILEGPFLLKPSGNAKDSNAAILTRVSMNSGVGLAVLNKIEFAQRQYRFQTVTSAELAQMTGMSLNNIHKIIAKLEAAGYVEIVGNQIGSGRGRPQRLLSLNFGYVMQEDK